MARAREFPGSVRELFVTFAAQQQYPDLVALASELSVRISLITDHAAVGLSETVTPQGIVALCEILDCPLETVFSQESVSRPKLVAVLVDISDPGNAGTVIRVADAAGADAVILAGNSVDPYNGKCVRASAGSLFHLPVVRARNIETVFSTCRAAGLALFSAHGYAKTPLDDIDLCLPIAWVFGNEAQGLSPEVLDKTDQSVQIPLYGKAESLNLATAAAVCLYTTAMAGRRNARDD